MEKTEAILINRIRYSETTLIVSWCSAEQGLFKTIAKGALRPKSPFSGLLDLFVSAEISYTHAKVGDLHTLSDAHWTNPRLGLRQSYGRVLAATYLVKLVELVAEPHAPLPEIHALLVKALDYLCDHDPSAALIERFELRLAEDLGLVGEGGAARGASAHAIEDNFHKRLPVQRRQVLDWISSRKGQSRPAGPETGPSEE
ncbi:DNA repair protein RecO [Brevifollis gellanilyticus]|uniref:DNA repair protein RecO n=1 Tax=Brevifollis gellanilyticus TaxID=748831 RepID=UPI001478827A|nr:DNA repair protein RecO [Brevifollis gellanilyticus]